MKTYFLILSFFASIIACGADFSAALIVIDKPFSVTSDVVISPRQTLRVEPGGYLDIAAGATLTVNGRLEAGAYRIFAGGGKVAGDARISAVLPEWFFDGAYNDESSDWAPAINRAIDWANTNCRIVRLEPRNYNVDSVIDLTSARGNNRAGMKLAGALRSTQYERGTFLIGNTGDGKPVIETTDTDGLHLVDLGLRAGSRNPSTIGVLQARGAEIGWGGDHYYENLYINMGSNPQVHNGIGTIGLVNLAAEESRYHNLQIWANLPMTITWTDSIMVTNPALNGSQRNYRFSSACGRPLAQNASNTVFAMSGLGRLIAYDYVSPCFLANAAGTVDMGHTFLQMRASGKPGVQAGSYRYAVENWNLHQFRLFGAIEGAAGFMLNRRTLGEAEINVRVAGVGKNNKQPFIQFYDDGGKHSWRNVNLTFHSYDNERPLAEYKRFGGQGGFVLEKCNFNGNLDNVVNLEVK